MTTQDDLEAYEDMLNEGLEEELYAFDNSERPAIVETRKKKQDRRYKQGRLSGKKFKPIKHQCKRCLDMFKATSKYERICPKCDKSRRKRE